MGIFKFGDFEIEFDPTEVAFVEKYEAAADNYSHRIAEIPKDGKASEIMQKICDVFYDVFDELFG